MKTLPIFPTPFFKFVALPILPTPPILLEKFKPPLLPTDYLSVFNHFVELALKRLKPQPAFFQIFASDVPLKMSLARVLIEPCFGARRLFV